MASQEAIVFPGIPDKTGGVFSKIIICCEIVT